MIGLIGLTLYVGFGIYALLATVVSVSVWLDGGDDEPPFWQCLWVGATWPYWLALAYFRPEPEFETWEGDDGEEF
jgi:hypothetical protein